jgi:hypothetical protein
VIGKYTLVEEFIATLEVEVQIFLGVGIEYNLLAITLTGKVIETAGTLYTLYTDTTKWK